jgi:tRNA C32,U32 (ribose-2'-O)-methylase TrmJ
MLKNFFKRTAIAFLFASILFSCDCGKDNNKLFANENLYNKEDLMTIEKAKETMDHIKMSEKKDCQMIKNFHENLTRMTEAHPDQNEIKGMISETENIVKMHCE